MNSLSLGTTQGTKYRHPEGGENMPNVIIARLRQLQSESEKGATAVEYGIMVALIAAVIVAVVTALGLEVQAAFQAVVDALPF